MAAPQPMPTSRDVSAALGRAAAALLPLLAVAGLRLLAPIELDGGALPAWIGVLAPAAVAAVLGLAAVALLGASLRTAGASTALAGTALGSLSIGLTLIAIGATDGAGEATPPGLAIAAASAGVLMLARIAFRDREEWLPSHRLWMLAGAFVVLEAVLLVSVAAGEATGEAARWLLGGGAIAVATARLAQLAAPGLRRRDVPGGLLLASSLGSLAVARFGSLDVMAGLAGLLAAGLLAGRDGVLRARVARSDEPEPSPAIVPVALLPPVAGDAPEPEPEYAAEEAARLARELRGTIEELLQARRTIELQRMEISRGIAVDALTGAASRRAILERLAIEVAEARRYSHAVAVVLLDIDDFRSLNEQHGLAVGDALLREMGLRMRLRMRAADALGRVGSDSFVAILPHTDDRGAARFANALLDRIGARAFMTDVGELRPAVSIGVALMRPGMDLSDEELLVAADEALGSARAAGGNRIAFDRLHGLARLEDTRRA